MKTYSKVNAIKLMKLNPKSEWSNPCLETGQRLRLRTDGQLQYDGSFPRTAEEYIWVNISFPHPFTDTETGWYPLGELEVLGDELIECDRKQASIMRVGEKDFKFEPSDMGGYLSRKGTSNEKCYMCQIDLEALEAKFYKVVEIEPEPELLVTEEEFLGTKDAYMWLGKQSDNKLGFEGYPKVRVTITGVKRSLDN